MKRLLLVAWVFGFVALGSACGGGGGAQDAGPDGLVDAGPDGDGAGPDHDPATSFLLRVPEGFELCPGFVEGRSWSEEWAMLSRVELGSGALVLPRAEGSLSVVNPVERVVFGPGREELSSPAGPIEAQAVSWNSSVWHEWTYTLRVPLTRAVGSAELEVQVRLGSQTGSWPAEITLGEEPYLAGLNAELGLDGGDSWIHERQKYGPCLPAGDPVRTVVAQAASGARLEAVLHQDAWWDGGCRMTGETACYYLTRATFSRDTYQAEITDRWRLVYNGSHHNWYDQYLVALDPPDGTTAFVLAISPDFFTQEGAELVYLDADFAELGRDPVPAWQQQ